jgi:hypothetical protein
MQLEHVPLLLIQRDLYNIPRGWDRFHEYICTMTGGTGDMVLPLVAMNPMGKEHVGALLDELLVLNAEDLAAEATAEAQRRDNSNLVWWSATTRKAAGPTAISPRRTFASTC